ncbi:MAG: ATP-binding cassette, subfamily F, member 3 [Verrucomicrobia bacterium]|jgi:ATP-binding cassette subfamily F protein 3|nr:MAG: ATP-binding cassette, subfamily F, member 3 [Verrucomicrobiota bacterium]
MLTLNEVEKGFGGRILFSGVNLQINARDRVGLVGPNGAGKSTLFSLILKEDTPDSGTVSMDKRCTLGYLPQESTPTGDETVLQVATSVRPEFTKLRAVLSAHEAAGTTDSAEYADAQAQFDEIGGYHLEPKAKRILRGLAFRESEFDRPMRELSGGWVMRAYLARLLVMEPDLLMLDEPTNHLDLHSLQWFQNYLKGYNGAILMISHDREFLNALTDSIIHIFHGKLHRYRGNYDSFLKQKEQREEQAWAAYRAQQAEIKKIEEFIARFRAKATKAAQAQSRIKQLEKMERLQPPSPPEATVHLRFPQPRQTGQKVVNLTNIHQAYGKTKVYQGMEFAAERGDRIVLVGPNGSGKSTMLKILAGELDFQQGERKLGLNVDVAYFAQYRSLMLDGNRSVLEEALSAPGRQSTEQETRTLLGCFLFRGDDVHKSVGVLSGGEKGRLALVKILLNPPNLLLMDEPTTHLDMPSIDALTQALKQFQGTLVFISHDVYFIRGIAEKVLHIEAGKLTWYAGGYDYYLEKSGADSERAALTAGQPIYVAPDVKTKTVSGEGSARKTKEQKRLEAEERQRRSQERKDLETALHRAESRVAVLEARREEITRLLDDPGLYQRDPGAVINLNRELAQLTDDLEAATATWEELAGKMEMA